MKIWLPTVRAGSGADVFVQRLAAGLEKAGHEAVIEWFDHRFELMPWRLRHRPPPRGTDIIHAGSWQGFAFKRAGIPLVVTEHNYVWHPGYLPYRGLARKVYHNVLVRQFLQRSYCAADALIAVSETTAAAMREDFDFDVRVVPNWVDTVGFQPLQPGADQRQDGRFRLLFVGNPSRWKGSDLLPELADRLGNTFEFVCVGGLRRSISVENSRKNMIAHQRVPPDRMPALYQSVDAVLVLARYEAFGFVALEAMACGLPVVGFANAGTTEVCGNQEAALLSPVDDLEKLIENIRRLRSEPELRRRLSAAGRSRAIARFGEEAGIQRYVRIYSNCLNRHAGWTG